MASYKIYKYTNKINGKVYIGQTKRTLVERAEGGKGYADCPAFYRAIQKYGFSNFVVEILKDELNQEEANYWEQFYIKLFDSTNSTKGYNCTIGGMNSSLRNRKKVICLETNKIYDSIADAASDTGINYRMISDCCNHTRGYKSCGGYHWSFYENGNYESVYVRKILCIENGKIYSSYGEAAADLNLKKESIAKVCRGDRNSLFGFHFKYIKEEVK